MLYEEKIIFLFNIKTFLKLKCTKVCNEFCSRIENVLFAKLI